MKKLMIAAAIVCAATMSQAVQYDWKVGSSAISDGAGDDAKATTMTTVYLFNSMDYTQQTLLSAFVAGNGSAATIASIIENSVDSATLTAGKYNSYSDVLSDSQFGSNDGSKAHSYIVVFDEAAKKVFINTTADKALELSAGGTTHLTAKADYVLGSKNTFTADASKAEGAFATNGAGWYTASAVPEPTSGLLLLLGVAGLALRRRRA